MSKQPFQQALMLYGGTLIALSGVSIIQQVSQPVAMHTLNTLTTSNPSTPSIVPPLSTSDLELKADSEVLEGQPLKLYLGSLPKAQEALAQSKLTLSYEDVAYDGKEIDIDEALEFQGLHYRKELSFQSPGEKTLTIKTSTGQSLKTKTINVLPFKASVFPKEWEKHKDYSQENSSDWHIWVNLYAEPRAPKGQRQYLQITYQDKIIDRLLISSGVKMTDTPLGSFKVGFKEEYPRSKRYNDTPMPFWSAINVNGNEGEWGFHSLDNGSYLYLLGKPASHGCIRLSRFPSLETNPTTGQQYWGDRGGARWIYDRVPKGTKVTIFREKLSAFEFEDYEKYLVNQAKNYRVKKKNQSERANPL